MSQHTDTLIPELELNKETLQDLGVDPIGMLRSFAVRVRTGNWSQGGSTITQQLARNIFLNNSRTFGRKVREAILAMALEWRFSKEQILELYLNRVYFGGGAYGIDAASRRFFGHSARELTVAESAIIAGLVKAPSNYSPTADAEAARNRAGVVLDLMVRNGAISELVPVTSTDFSHTFEASAEGRYGVEVVRGTAIEAITTAAEPGRGAQRVAAASGRRRPSLPSSTPKQPSWENIPK